jgi:hypothetical protein
VPRKDSTPLWQETAALWDFNPGYVAFGSIATETSFPCHVRFAPVRTKWQTSPEVRFVPIVLQKSKMLSPKNLAKVDF